MDIKEARIRELENECQSLIDSFVAFRMQAMCHNQELAETDAAKIAKQTISHARAMLGDDFLGDASR